MGANIITGYTGTRHITPAMDASVFRSLIGPDEYILNDGDKCVGSMPDINHFTVAGGNISLQGYQVQITQETLTVDTCATGYQRIDLVALRYRHDTTTQIDSFTLEIIKGEEVAGTPAEPSYNTGEIEAGVNEVDMILYRIDLDGSTVTFTTRATTISSNLSFILGAYDNTPNMDGVGSAGSSGRFARGDHTHPTDNTRVPTTRTVNGKALSSDIALDASDVGVSTSSATIQVANWSSYSATISVPGVTSSNTVIVSPAPSSLSDWTDNEVKCTGQGSGTLTFTCATTPNSAISVNVVVIS